MRWGGPAVIKAWFLPCTDGQFDFSTTAVKAGDEKVKKNHKTFPV